MTIRAIENASVMESVAKHLQSLQDQERAVVVGLRAEFSGLIEEVLHSGPHYWLIADVYRDGLGRPGFVFKLDRDGVRHGGHVNVFIPDEVINAADRITAYRQYKENLAREAGI